MASSEHRTLHIDELLANRQTVSIYRYGFFLCLAGQARILLGKRIYLLSQGTLCIYAPNTLFKIIEKSADLHGILEEYVIDTYYPVVSTVGIKERLQIRHMPCVEVSADQAQGIAQLVEMARREPGEQCALYLRYAVCQKVLDAYFSNKPLAAIEQGRDESIVSRFIAAVYEHCHQQRTVQYYASLQHLSPYYFSSIIKRASGRSAMQWIEGATMTLARQYLDTPDMSLKEVAERLHFPDQSSFGRYFRQHEGCSPTEYRSQRHDKRP